MNLDVDGDVNLVANTLTTRPRLNIAKLLSLPDQRPTQHSIPSTLPDHVHVAVNVDAQFNGESLHSIHVCARDRGACGRVTAPVAVLRHGQR